MVLFQCFTIFRLGPPGPPGELPLLPPDILFQRDSPITSARSKRELRGDIDTSKLNAGQVNKKNIKNRKFVKTIICT